MPTKRNQPRPSGDTESIPVTETSSDSKRAPQQTYESQFEQSSRKPAADRPNAFNPLAWLIDGATGLVEELRHSDLGLSEEFWAHAYAARRESLYALRAALDALITQIESQTEHEAKQQQRRERRGNIEIT
jgi:hypothetical protein